MPTQDTRARYEALVGPPGPSGCQLWLGRQVRRTSKLGLFYGVLDAEGNTFYAHRLAFLFARGHWPAPLCRHTCDNGLCVNPAHLLEGTDADNSRDMMERGRHGQLAKTHCPHGHEYTPENTKLYQGRRFCRTCDRERKRKG